MTQKISAQQAAHIARNEMAKLAAQDRKAGRIDAHRRRNADTSIEASMRRDQRIANHQARNEAATINASTQAYALEIERRYGIVANDNYALARAA